ncbi:MAG: Rho termination factor N-terminal domain-containing protein, partial [Deltaproteobacteria bacterium]
MTQQDRLNLSDLKAKTPKDLLTMAEELEIENASTMRKGEMMFSILKEYAEEGYEIGGDGVLEVLQDGFGFLRSPSANYLPGPDDIYVSPEVVRQHAMRTGDTVEGVIQAPRENERYFA